MKRRDNLRLLITGGIGIGAAASLESCKNEDINPSQNTVIKSYGRTEDEIKHDVKVMSETFFSKEELKTVTILSDIIIPKDEKSGSASEAGVPAFIEFMMKDQPEQQLPMRGGLKWLDSKCNTLYGKIFSLCSREDQIALIDQIAYPDTASPEMKPGVKFFNIMRNLVTTGFFTSQMGVKDLDYKGNTPNEWDGVPSEVMKKHGVALEEKYISLYVDPKTRNDIMVF
jgi:gluconate 2-dehydrogenase gamma chain